METWPFGSTTQQTQDNEMQQPELMWKRATRLYSQMAFIKTKTQWRMWECKAREVQHSRVHAVSTGGASGQQREERQRRQLLVRSTKGEPAALPRPSTHHCSCFGSVPGHEIQPLTWTLCQTGVKKPGPALPAQGLIPRGHLSSHAHLSLQL